MSSITNNDTWREFFALFHELPELWQVKSEIFKNKPKKTIAWERLLVKYKEIEPAANLETLKQRVRNIRCVYRRELKKIEQSQRSGASADDTYVPSIWYFDHLHFLKDQENTTPSVSSIDIEALEETPETPMPAAKRRRTNREQMDERNKILKDAVERLTSQSKDQAAVFGEGWTESYRMLKPMQQIYAKQAIERIFFMGMLDQLSYDFVSSLSAPSVIPEEIGNASTSTLAKVVPDAHNVTEEGSYATFADLFLDTSYNEN